MVIKSNESKLILSFEKLTVNSEKSWRNLLKKTKNAFAEAKCVFLGVNMENKEIGMKTCNQRDIVPVDYTISHNI